MDRNNQDDQVPCPGSYAGLLGPGQRQQLLRGDRDTLSYRGFSHENHRLLCGRTLAEGIRYTGQSEDELDIFNLVLPAPEEADD